MAKAKVQRPEWMLNPVSLISALQNFLSPGDVDPRMLALTGMGPTQLPTRRGPDLGAVREPAPLETLGMAADLFAPGIITGGAIPTRHAMARALKSYKNFAQVGSPMRKALLSGLRKGVKLTEKAPPGAAGHFTPTESIDEVADALTRLAGETPTAAEIGIHAKRGGWPSMGGRELDPLSRVAERARTGQHELGHLIEKNLPIGSRLNIREAARTAGKQMDPRALAEAAFTSRASEAFAYGLEDILSPVGKSTPISLDTWNLLFQLAQK